MQVISLTFGSRFWKDRNVFRSISFWQKPRTNRAYLTMLVRLDRAQEAFDNGLKQLTTPGAALTSPARYVNMGSASKVYAWPSMSHAWKDGRQNCSVVAKSGLRRWASTIWRSVQRTGVSRAISLENYLHAAN